MSDRLLPELEAAHALHDFYWHAWYARAPDTSRENLPWHRDNCRKYLGPLWTVPGWWR